MEPENGHGDEEGNQNAVFVDTSLDTYLAIMVSDSDTVSDLKRKIMLEHRRCFPAIGDIKIHCLKVKRRGKYYHLSDSMLVKCAFGANQKSWYISVDASHLEQCDGIQHNPGDQLALPWVKDTRSIDTHDSQAQAQANRPSKLSLNLIHGSTSKLPKILVPFVNQKVPSVTSDGSCKKVSKNIEEDRSSNLEPGLEQQLDSKVTEKLYTVDKEIKSKKRTRDVHNEDASVMKRRKTQRTEGDAKDLEENRVLTNDADKVKDMGTSINDENSIEDKSKGKDAALDGVVTKAMNDEHTINISVGQKKPKKTKKGKISSHDQVDIVAPLSVEDVGEEAHHQKNTKSIEVIPDVAMVVAKNIEQDIPFQSKSKDAALDSVVKKKPKRSKKGKISAHDQVAIVVPSSVEDHQKKTESSEVVPDVAMVVAKNIQQDIPFQSSQEEKGNELVQEADIGNEIPSSSMKGVTADEVMLENLVVDISSAVPTPVFDEKLVDEQNNDKTNIISDEKSQVSVKTSMDDSLVCNKKVDDLIMKEVKIVEPTESNRSPVQKEKSRNRNKKKDVGKSSKKYEILKHSDDAVIVTNEENLLPTSERKESLGITSIDALHVDKDAEISQTSQQIAEVSGKQNENMDDEPKSKKKKKKKSKKSAAINEVESLTKHGNVNLLEKFADASQTDDDKLKSKDSQISTRAHSDKPSEHEPEPEPEKSEIPEETLKNVTVSQVLKGNDVNSDVGIPKEGSHDIDFMDYFSPSQQQNKIAPLDNVENRKDSKVSVKEKKLKKKSKEQNDNAIQSLSRNENNKALSSKVIPEASTDGVVVKDQNAPGITKLKTQQGDSAIQYLSRNENNKALSLKKIPEASTDGVVVKDQNAPNITKLKTQQDDSAIQSLPRNENNKVLSSKKIPEASMVKDQNAPDITKVKSQKTTTKIDGLKMSKPAQVKKAQASSVWDSSSESESFGRPLKSQKKATKQQPTQVKNLKKNVPGVKSLLNTPGTIFGDNSDDESSANDNAIINSDSSTRTPSRKSSSSSGESDSSIDSRRYGVKRKEGGGNNNINSQSRLKKISMADLLRSSSRFKKARVTASQSQVNDTESEPVDFVPESQPHP